MVKKLNLRVSFALAVGMLLSLSVSMVKAAPAEYELKAGFIFNFLKFITWPASVTGNSICTIGEDPFQNAFDKMNEKMGMSVVIKRNIPLSEVPFCKVLFISDDSEANLSKIFSKLDSHPVLTISDINDFSANDGIIEFVTIDSYIRFKINNTKARQMGLQVSAKLLELSVNNK